MIERPGKEIQMKGRLPLVLSITALLIAAIGFTPLVEAASEAIPRFARNADRVDGIHAARRPRAGFLYPLAGNRKFPTSVLTIPAARVNGHDILMQSSAADSSSPKSVVVSCPAGKKVLGGGSRVTGAGAAEVGVVEEYPNAVNQWTTLAREQDPTGSAWTLTAHAICANAS
jgi:hypothetical protein